MIRVISLGAGVQSTTMALMAAKGEITPMPDCAIFADTGWEPKKVYAHLDRLETQLPFPVHRVSAGNLRDDYIERGRGGKTVRSIPCYIKAPDGSSGISMRQCTKAYKIEPIKKKTRELMGYRPGERIKKGDTIEMWIGISTDEIVRMKDAQDKWQKNRWPLIEKRMSRFDCLAWLERSGYQKAPKSSCLGCPYHSDAQWREIKDFDPEGWADVVAFDEAIRTFPRIRGQQFLHKSLVPLADADLRTAEDAGQLNMFNDECDGMCGV